MDSYSPHPANPPEWATQTFLTQALRKGLRDETFELIEFTSSPASTEKHYSSQMFRYESVIRRASDNKNKTEKFRFIFKAMPTGEIEVHLREARLFQIESHMLSETLPEVDAVLKKAFPDHEPLHAVCYGHGTEPDEWILVQDLKESGYQLSDRCLNTAHVELVLKSFGKLHAASTLVIQNRPETKEYYGNSLRCRKNAHIYDNMFNQACNFYNELTGPWKTDPERRKLYEKFKKIEKNLCRETMKLYERNDDSFNVIIHGDVWSYNVMFRYDQGTERPAGIKLVDFQEANYNNPVLDLLFFIYTSTDEDILFGDPERILKIYYGALTETWNNLNWVPDRSFTFEMLEQEYRSKMFAGLATLLVSNVSSSIISDVHAGNKSAAKFEGLLMKALTFFESQGVI